MAPRPFVWLFIFVELILSQICSSQTPPSTEPKLFVNLSLVNSDGYPLAGTDRVHIEITNPYDGKVVTADEYGSVHRFEMRYHGNNAGDLKVQVSGPYFARSETTLPKHVENHTQTATLTVKPIGWAPFPSTWEGIRQCCTDLARILSDDGNTASHSHYDRTEIDNPNLAAGLTVALEYARSTKIGNKAILEGIRALDWNRPIQAGDAKVWEIHVWADPAVVAAWRANQSAEFEQLRSLRGEAWEELGNKFFIDWAPDGEEHKLVTNVDCVRLILRFRPFSVATYESLVYENSTTHVDFHPPLSIYRGWNKMPLFAALYHGTLADVRQYLDAGTKLDSVIPATGTSLLTVAAEAGRSDFVDLLISRGADVNVEGGGPLRAAATNGSAVISKSLLTANAKQLADADGYTPVMLGCKSGQTKVVETLISAHAGLSQRTRSRESLLELAVRSGRGSLVRLLLANGFDAKEKTSSGDSLVAVAAKNGFASALEELLNAGAKPDDSGAAVAVASMNGFTDIVSILLAHKASPDAGAPLFHAAAEGFTEIVKMLLAAGANPNASIGEGSQGFSALAVASLRGHVEIVKELLEHHADPNLTTSISNPLVAAAIEGSPETVLLLLKAGATPSVRINGKTALDFARERHNYVVVDVLKSHKGSTAAIPKEFTWDLIGRNPGNLRRQLLNTSVFSDLQLLTMKDISGSRLNLTSDASGRLCAEASAPQSRLSQAGNVNGRLCSEVAFLISTASQLYHANKKNLEVAFGPLPENPKMTLDLIDRGSAGAYMDSDGTLTFDVKLIRANLAASIISAFPELSSDSDIERVAYIEELRRKIRLIAGVNTLEIKPTEPGGFTGSFPNPSDLSKLGEYEQLLELAAQVMPSDVQYFGTLLFVVAHEMGHAALNHFSKTDVDCADLELQADHFAALLLGESFIALSAKVISVQWGGLGLGTNHGSPMWFLDREALDRYTGFSVFLDKGYEFSKFTGSSTCTYPSPERRLAATRSVLNQIVKSDAERIISRIQKRKDFEAVLRASFAERFSFLGMLH
jgi:ankyrin repeat protein